MNEIKFNPTMGNESTKIFIFYIVQQAFIAIFIKLFKIQTADYRFAYL